MSHEDVPATTGTDAVTVKTWRDSHALPAGEQATSWSN